MNFIPNSCSLLVLGQ